MPPSADVSPEPPAAVPADAGVPADDDAPRWPPRITPWRVLGGLVILAIIGMWVYALSPWSYQEPKASVENRDWLVAEIEPLCEQLNAQLAALPFATQVASPAERAVVLDQANAHIADFVATGRTRVPASARDAELVAQWWVDWTSYLDARRVYADRLRAGEDVPFYVEAADGQPITMRMDWFTRVNRLPACDPPGDV